MSWGEFLTAFQIKMLNKPRIRDKVQDRIIQIESIDDPGMEGVGGKLPFIGLMIDDIVPDYVEKQHITEDFPILVVVFNEKHHKDPQLSLSGPGGLYIISEIVTADVDDGGMNNDIDYTYTGPDIVELHWVRTRRPERLRSPKHPNLLRQISEFVVTRDTVMQLQGV